MPTATLPYPRQRRLVANTLTLLLAVVIAGLTLFPNVRPPGGFEMQDKVYHAIAFAALVLPSATLYPRALIWALPFGLLLGGAIEIIQPWVGRGRELADFVADAIGIGTGLMVGLWLQHWLRRRFAR